MLLISVDKTYTINKSLADIAWAVTTMPVFISDLNKSNDGKFQYLVGSVLQSWAALKDIISVQCFLVLGFDKVLLYNFEGYTSGVFL